MKFPTGAILDMKYLLPQEGKYYLQTVGYAYVEHERGEG